MNIPSENIKNEATLFDGVLNDDYIVELEDKYVFRGHNKAKVVLVYYTYANAWGDHENTKFFKTTENALKWYEKNFRDRVVIMGKSWLYAANDEEEHGVAGEIDQAHYDKVVAKYTDDDAITEWENNISDLFIG